jgi:hypothetical protein
VNSQSFDGIFSEKRGLKDRDKGKPSSRTVNDKTKADMRPGRPKGTRKAVKRKRARR